MTWVRTTPVTEVAAQIIRSLTFGFLSVAAYRSKAADRRTQITELEAKRRKLLQLFYDDKISAEGSHNEEQRLAAKIAAIDVITEPDIETAPPEQFERVLELLPDIDLGYILDAASDTERRTLLDAFVPTVNAYGAHLEVEVRGAPRLNVALPK
jgi:hypothetical protein